MLSVLSFGMLYTLIQSWPLFYQVRHQEQFLIYNDNLVSARKHLYILLAEIPQSISSLSFFCLLWSVEQYILLIHP